VNATDPTGLAPALDEIVVTAVRTRFPNTSFLLAGLFSASAFGAGGEFAPELSSAAGGNTGGNGEGDEEQPGKEDSCAQQQSYANLNQYVSAGQLEGVLQNAIENTSFAQFAFPELGNGIDRFGPRYTATSRGFVDLQHVVYSGFSASGAFGLGEALGLRVFNLSPGQRQTASDNRHFCNPIFTQTHLDRPQRMTSTGVDSTVRLLRVWSIR